MRSLIFASLLALTACGTDSRDEPGMGSGSGSGSDAEVDPAWLGVTAWDLATDATYLYFSTDILGRVPLDGGATETLYTMEVAADEFATMSQITIGPQDIVFVLSRTSTAGGTAESTRDLMRVAKSGGPATVLASSTDSRAFLGIAIDGDQVYYSTFTSVLRVPLAGGAVKFVGESPNSVRYWVYSPTIVGDDLFFIDGGGLYKLPKTSLGGDGTLVAALPGVGMIIGGGGDEPFVISIRDSVLTGASSFVEVDPASGVVSSPIAFSRAIDQAAVTDDAVWAVSFDGVERVPRDGGAPTMMAAGLALSITASDDAVFAGTNGAVTRLAL